MVFCNNELCQDHHINYDVTILILIDGFLQSQVIDGVFNCPLSHNPYFNRWFSAILIQAGFICITNDVTILILIDGFLQ